MIIVLCKSLILRDMNILYLLIGVVLIIGGANYLTEGASGIAKKFRVSEFVIGLTIIGLGTSMPELVISIFSAIRDHSDMAIGNVVGSNMFNTLVILGLTSLIRPIAFTKGNLTRDLPFAMLATVALIIMGSDVVLGSGKVNAITRNEGLLLLCFFAIFIAYSILEGRTREKTMPTATTPVKQPKMWLMTVMIVGGLAALVWGGDLVLDSATAIARNLKVSESVIAITLVAVGTSLPELAISIVAIIKRNGALALGNIIGSNVFNIFLVLGASSTISPLTMSNILPGDLWVLLATNVLLFIFAFTFRKRAMDRPEGVIALLCYAAYMWWILAR
jgi:cation:H+ antiporter